MNTDLCKIEPPYKLKKNNFSFNKKDEDGIINFFLIMIFIILTILYIKKNNIKNI